jgi:hypothetical protein
MVPNCERWTVPAATLSEREQKENRWQHVAKILLEACERVRWKPLHTSSSLALLLGMKLRVSQNIAG